MSEKQPTAQQLEDLKFAWCALTALPCRPAAFVAATDATAAIAAAIVPCSVRGWPSACLPPTG